MHRTITTFAMILAASTWAFAQSSARAELKNGKGDVVGQASLMETPLGVLITVKLSTIAAGEHAFHVHAVGKCEAPTFQSAAGHYNPAGKQHGLKNPQGHHAGDLPNVFVPASGSLEFTKFVDGLKMSDLFDADGAALVLHDGADDYASDPAGNAGGRAACGVIEKAS